MGEASLLARVTAAAHERHLSQNTLIAYRPIWLKLIAWWVAEGVALETMPSQRAGEFTTKTTRGRSASHHLQVKQPSRCSMASWGPQIHLPNATSPKFAPEKIELRYHTVCQLGQLMRELREDRGSYFGHLTYHLATAPLFSRLPISRVGATHDRPARP